MQELQSECCVHNCYSELQARGMSCGDAGRARDPFDLYDPFAGDWHMVGNEELKQACCQMTCDTLMSMRNLTCDAAGGHMRGPEDWHVVVWHNSSSDDYLRHECCVHNCHSYFNRIGLQCMDGTELRLADDWHMPFGSMWDVQSNASLQAECCKSRCGSLVCPGSATMVGDCHHRPEMDMCSVKECCAMPTCASWVWIDNMTGSHHAKECPYGERRDMYDEHRCAGPECTAADCCHVNCFQMSQHRSDFMCPNGTQVRSEHDWHVPY